MLSTEIWKYLERRPGAVPGSSRPKSAVPAGLHSAWPSGTRSLASRPEPGLSQALAGPEPGLRRADCTVARCAAAFLCLRKGPHEGWPVWRVVCHLHGGLPTGPGHCAPHLLQVCPQQQLLRGQQAAQPHRPPPCPWAEGLKAQTGSLLLPTLSRKVGVPCGCSPLPCGDCISWSSLAPVAPWVARRYSWGPGGWWKEEPVSCSWRVCRQAGSVARG